MAPRTKIHAYLEIAEDKYSAGVARISMASNYRAFALMANVRNDGGITPVAPLRGFPPAMCKGAEEYFKEVEAESGKPLHSKTFLTLPEMESVLAQVDGFIPGVVACVWAMQGLTKKGSNPRFVIAFED